MVALPCPKGAIQRSQSPGGQESRKRGKRSEPATCLPSPPAPIRGRRSATPLERTRQDTKARYAAGLGNLLRTGSELLDREMRKGKTEPQVATTIQRFPAAECPFAGPFWDPLCFRGWWAFPEPSVSGSMGRFHHLGISYPTLPSRALPVSQLHFSFTKSKTKIAHTPTVTGNCTKAASRNEPPLGSAYVSNIMATAVSIPKTSLLFQLICV